MTDGDHKLVETSLEGPPMAIKEETSQETGAARTRACALQTSGADFRLIARWVFFFFERERDFEIFLVSMFNSPSLFARDSFGTLVCTPNNHTYGFVRV